MEAYNPNPTVLKPSSKSARRELQALSTLWDIEDTGEDSSLNDDCDEVEEIDQDEIFGASTSRCCWNLFDYFIDLIRHITDPEHKHMSLEQLMVVSASQCTVSNSSNRIAIEFTPTVPHCGMSTVIGW